jgi:hypothetical protein
LGSSNNLKPESKRMTYKGVNWLVADHAKSGIPSHCGIPSQYWKRCSNIPFCVASFNPGSGRTQHPGK